jgi:hypothetical protein
MSARPRSFDWLWTTLTLLGVLALAAILLEGAASAAPARKARFFDVPSQTAEFVGYNRSIALTPAQEKVRETALAAMDAPCCKKFSMATCCCPCNLAKSVWGLSNAMIVREHATPAQIRTAVKGWLKLINGQGFSGDACDTAGGCGRKFSNNGCGGMDERNLVAAR